LARAVLIALLRRFLEQNDAGVIGAKQQATVSAEVSADGASEAPAQQTRPAHSPLYAFAERTNFISKSLFTSTGFVVCGEVVWARMKYN
jgi:hypothetical protein